MDIRNLCEVKYESNGTSSTFDKALSALQKLGYNANNAGLPDFIKLRTEIKSHYPVYISGQNEERKVGHAWICEGYLHKKYQSIISTIADKKYVLPNPNSLYSDYELYINSPSDSNDSSTGEYYYMNFGWGNSNANGWYRANSYRPSDLDHCYMSNQEMITIRK